MRSEAEQENSNNLQNTDCGKERKKGDILQQRQVTPTPLATHSNNVQTEQSKRAVRDKHFNMPSREFRDDLVFQIVTGSCPLEHIKKA
jgi:hypothetical protein